MVPFFHQVMLSFSTASTLILHIILQTSLLDVCNPYPMVSTDISESLKNRRSTQPTGVQAGMASLTWDQPCKKRISDRRKSTMNLKLKKEIKDLIQCQHFT